MTLGVAEAICLLWEAMTLVPGDVIVLGIRSGVGLARTPQLVIRAEDGCEGKMEEVETLRISVVAKGAGRSGAA